MFGSSIPLVNVSVYAPIPCVVQLEIGNGDTSTKPFLIQDCFVYSEFLTLVYEAEECSFSICDKLYWNFDRDCIESVDCLGRMAIFYYFYY